MNKPAILLSLALLCGLTKREAQAEVFGLADLDVLVISTTAIYNSDPIIASDGDFNGDGYDDVAVTKWSEDDTDGYIIFGGNLPKTSQLSNVASIKIFGISSLETSCDSLLFSDLNHDGKDDLILTTLRLPFNMNSDHAYVFFGSSVPPSQYDVRTIQPNEGIILGSSRDFSTENLEGDFTGDGIDDLFLTENGRNSSFLFSGKEHFDNPTYQLDQGVAIKLTNCSDINPNGKTTGGDINGDGITDIVSKIPVYPSYWAIIFGTTTFQSPWDV